MIGLIGLWSHSIAAIFFGALAVWQLRHWNTDPDNRPLVAAFAVMSVWAIFVALLGPRELMSGLAESARNFAFLAFMYGMLKGAFQDGRQRSVKLVYAVVGGVIGLQIVIAGVLPQFEGEGIVYDALTATANVLGLTIAAGSLVLVHNLYGQAAPESRWAIRLPMIALACMWGYDLHLYTVAYLTRDAVPDLFAMRGAIVAMAAPLFILASRRSVSWKMQISRAATFQSLSVMAILVYLILMMSATQAMEVVGGQWVRLGQIGFVFAMTVAAAVVLPSGKARAWLGVMLAKHLFEHRYDYREEWLGFTRTIAQRGEDSAPLADRIAKAVADIAGSPAALLLTIDDQHRAAPAAYWNWSHPVGMDDPAAQPFFRFVERTAHVVDFDQARSGRLGEIPVPGWMAAEGGAWAGIPLLHGEKLVGFVLLAHPLVRRPLDWEDFDLFRSVGTQAASYLAEALSQEALANVQRFDEFNRRFAFIMHDIKNLVSQLSLVTRNAERHAHNPEFRADMIATLQSSVKKMNDLLARLSPAQSAEAEPLRPTPLDPILVGIAAAKNRIHPVAYDGDPDLGALADPARLDQAVAHLVQNAIDASGDGAPVRISGFRRGFEAAIEVADEGVGMSADFIRTRLFQPFASTKETGFGIGAFEARSLIASMGGRLEVDSREGQGSRFTIFLPAAATASAPIYERMRA
jgi:putative PEP-CTERM system histidine kinase